MWGGSGRGLEKGKGEESAKSHPVPITNREGRWWWCQSLFLLLSSIMSQEGEEERELGEVGRERVRGEGEERRRGGGEEKRHCHTATSLPACLSCPGTVRLTPVSPGQVSLSLSMSHHPNHHDPDSRYPAACPARKKKRKPPCLCPVPIVIVAICSVQFGNQGGGRDRQGRREGDCREGWWWGKGWGGETGLSHQSCLITTHAACLLFFLLTPGE